MDLERLQRLVLRLSRGCTHKLATSHSIPPTTPWSTWCKEPPVSGAPTKRVWISSTGVAVSAAIGCGSGIAPTEARLPK
jgi:hypothetical protein